MSDKKGFVRLKMNSIHSSQKENITKMFSEMCSGYEERWTAK